MLVFFTDLSLMEFQISYIWHSFVSNRQLRVALDGKSSQEYPVNAGVPQGSIFGATLFLLYINELSDDVICKVNIYADNATLYSKYDQACDLCQQQDLASELEYDLQDTENEAGRGLLMSLLKKLNWLI